MRSCQILKPVLSVTLCALMMHEVLGVTVLNSPADFSRPSTLIDFENFPSGTPVPLNSANLKNQWSSIGVVISDGTGFGGNANGKTFDVNPHSGTRALTSALATMLDDDGFNIPGGSITYHFFLPRGRVPTTAYEAGLWIQNGDEPDSIDFLDESGSVLKSMTTVGTDFFAGLRAAEGIAAIRVTHGGFGLTDDLQFSFVPEPTCVGLIAVATLFLGCWRKTR